MITCYLTKEIVGKSSRICYGVIGDKVFIINRNHEMILVCNQKNVKFYIKEGDYSFTNDLFTNQLNSKDNEHKKRNK